MRSRKKQEDGQLSQDGHRVRLHIVVEVDRESWFFKNCKRQRKNGAKICDSCPFAKALTALG